MMRSLRARLIVGALLWTVGLTLVVHYASLAMIRHSGVHMVTLHFGLLGILAVGLIIAALTQIRSGMSPIQRLRERLARVRSGASARIDGSYPSEVQPLVDDLNALLDDREHRVARAQTKAADLAHGLKTPLAVMAQEAARLRASGSTAAAGEMEEQIGRMREQVEYHLAGAQAVGGGAPVDARTSILEVAESLGRTLRKLYAERGIALEIRVAPEHVVRLAKQDLEEMLGNVLDNAFKWAAERVEVKSFAEPGFLSVTVEDDGPGLAPELRAAVLQRGIRADTASEGSGIGLAIVRDIAMLHGCTVALEEAALGGLRVVIRIPAV